MHDYDTAEEESTDLEPRDDCACTPLLACFEHYDGERGRPAVRRVN